MQAADSGQVAAAARAKRGHQGKRSASHELIHLDGELLRRLTATDNNGARIDNTAP